MQVLSLLFDKIFYFCKFSLNTCMYNFIINRKWYRFIKGI